jgi:transcriptional regulator with XRE-family HTH domain
MKERLKQLRKSLGLTQGELGKKIGMSDVAISYMESGRTALSKQNIRLICLTFGVREEWLENGEGDMMDDEALLSEKEKRLLELFRKLSPKAQVMIIEYVEKLLSDEQALRGEKEVNSG